MTLNQLASAEPNPFTVKYKSSSYEASDGEFIIADGTGITLPDPKDGGQIVGIRTVGSQTVKVDTAVSDANVADASVGKIDSTKPMYFVSDGTTEDWYLFGDLYNFIPAIPDRGDLHSRYDASELTDASTFPDATGNGYDLSSTNSPLIITDAQNNLNVVDYAAGNPGDRHSLTYNSNISQPVHIFAVMRLTSTDGNAGASNEYLLSSTNSSNLRDITQADESEWRLYGGSNITGGSPDTNWHIFNALYDGSNSKLEIDKTSIASGDAGTNSPDGISISAAYNGNAGAAMRLGELLQYPSDKTAVESDVVDYLNYKWNVF